MQHNGPGIEAHRSGGHGVAGFDRLEQAPAAQPSGGGHLHLVSGQRVAGKPRLVEEKDAGSMSGKQQGGGDPATRAPTMITS